MNIALYGTGRAAGALGIAFSQAGHTIVGVHGRSPGSVAGTRSLFDVTPGPVDLRVIAVSDDAIPEVAAGIADLTDRAASVHVSGAVSIAALDAIAATGSQIGSFHPLQTMPGPVTGARQLPGSWIGITADEPLRSHLIVLASSIGCNSFDIADDAKPLYHAAAAASANFTLAVLSLAKDLFDGADVPFASARPLVESIIENAFALGPTEALTGPIARGDRETVRKQLAAVRTAVPGRYEEFVILSQITARTAGTAEMFSDVLT